MDKISSFLSLDNIDVNRVRIPAKELDKPKIIDPMPFSDFDDLARTIMDNPFPVERKVNFHIIDKNNLPESAGGDPPVKMQ